MQTEYNVRYKDPLKKRYALTLFTDTSVVTARLLNMVPPLFY